MQRAQTAPSPTRPRLLQALIDAWRQPDVRYKLAFTLGMLIVFRFLAHVPVPNVDRVQLGNALDNNPVLGFLNLFSGGGLENLSIVALGVYPYITASIVIQLMTPMIPRLQALSKEGETGRNRIQLYTYWFALPMSFVQGYGQLLLLENANAIQGIGFSGAEALPTLAAVISMTAGTMFLIWLGELITEKGIGNGISLIIFGGIIASFPTLFNSIRASDTGASGILIVIAIAVVLVALIVFFQEAQRRIPVQYARSVFRGGRMYRQSGQSHIPLRVNSAGMIPLIFAFSIIIFPSVIAGWITGTAGEDTATRVRVELPFSVDQADELRLTEAFPTIAPEGEIRVNEGEVAWNAEDDSFRDVVDQINRANQANVLTRIEAQTDPASGDIVPTWTIENNEIGSELIVLEDVEGDLIANTGVRTHLDGPDDPLTVDVVEGQTIGERPGVFVRIADWVQTNFSPGRPLYWVLSFMLVFAFTFFYTVITFQQQNISENLQKQGGFVPGIRPGRPTQDYVNKVLIRITFAGALFLGFIAIVPFLTTEFIPDSQALTISSTGLLIVVGVALDTMKQVESQLLMRNYEGFIR
ncbi:MAG: Preprotein translocase subunit SecY [Chloroflexi bacterium]|nr:MAG: Preprotein translocase subunit SecY [Chloroflexota bacterium]